MTKGEARIEKLRLLVREQDELASKRLENQRVKDKIKRIFRSDTKRRHFSRIFYMLHRRGNKTTGNWKEFYEWVCTHEHPICHYCKRLFPGWTKMTVDHAVPISRGGHKWFYMNLRLACRTCNMVKGSLTEGEFLALSQGFDRFYETFPQVTPPFYAKWEGVSLSASTNTTIPHTESDTNT